MFDVEVQEKSSGAPESLTAQDTQVMRVRWQGDDCFDIQVREHTITVDQPVEVGGADVGPTPTELFVASLASCVGFYVRRYLRRHHVDATGLVVTTSYRMGANPARVAAVDMEIHLSAELPSQRRAGLLAQARHCTVHNSITHTPDIAITLTPES
jgi:putative redox protein